jgi:hypothetical protein
MTGARRWVLLAALLTGCGGEESGSTEPTTTAPSITTAFTSVRAVTATGAVVAPLRTDTVPPSVGGATVTVRRAGVLIAGGSTLLSLTSTVNFSRAIVASDDARGYFEVTFATPVREAVLAITVPQTPRASVLPLRVAVGTGNSLSTYATESITLTRATAGPIQASVAWIDSTDVDVSLVEPSGRELYYGAPTSASGGRLDLDSNTGCATLDGRNAENISYPVGATPPAGSYVFRVNLWSACTRTTSTTYVATLVVRGVVQTFVGTLPPPGMRGGAGAGIEVARFTY